MCCGTRLGVRVRVPDRGDCQGGRARLGREGFRSGRILSFARSRPPCLAYRSRLSPGIHACVSTHRAGRATRSAGNRERGSGLAGPPRNARKPALHELVAVNRAVSLSWIGEWLGSSTPSRCQASTSVLMYIRRYDMMYAPRPYIYLSLRARPSRHALSQGFKAPRPGPRSFSPVAARRPGEGRNGGSGGGLFMVKAKARC